MNYRKVIAVVCILVLLLASGCKTRYVTQEVAVPVEHTTETVRVDIVRDTVRWHDSVYHYVQGDTVIIERWHTLQNTNHVTKVDTVVEYKEKPVTLTRTELREVNVLKWWQKLLMCVGVVAVAGGAVWAAIKLRIKN